MEADAIIVGAGYAGLIAARELSAAGKTVVVIEANCRAGGRAFSAPFAETGIKVDWGAEWILPGHHHAVVAEMQRYGIEMEYAHEVAKPRWIVGNEEVRGDLADLKRSRPGFAKILRDLEIDATIYASQRDDTARHVRSLAATLYQNAHDELDSGLIDAALFPLTGAHPNDLSMAMIWNEVRFHGGSIDETIEPAEICRIKGGTTSIADHIAADLRDSIHFNHQVMSVGHDGNAVTVRGAFGKKRARNVIVALPLNVLQTIEFDPPLHDDQLRLSKSGNVGRTLKLWALLEGPRQPETCYLTGHAVRLTYARQMSDGAYLVCAQALTDELKDRSDEGLRAIFQNLYPEHQVKHVELLDWVEEPWARGSWQASGMASGMGCVEAVNTRFRHHGNIIFAGGDFMDPWCGWIEGAILSGRRAAAECLRELALAATPQ
jgi:monoamine oxidase